MLKCWLPKFIVGSGKFCELSAKCPVGGVCANVLCPKLSEHVLVVPYPDTAGNQS